MNPFHRYAGRLAAIVFAISSTGAIAHAACEDLDAAFDRAVAANSIDGARHAAADIRYDNLCAGRGGARADEYQAKLVAFLVALADAATTSATDRAHAVEVAEESLGISGTWRTAAMLADYFMRRGNKADALKWYEQSVSFLGTKPATATEVTPADWRTLLTKTAAVKILANDDQEGKKAIAWAPSMRELDGKIGGVYSPLLVGGRGAAIVPVPLPINFFYNETRFTPGGELAVAELAQAVREQQVRTMKLVGHADPRGTAQYNMDLSRRRAEAVRDELLRRGVSAPIMLDWKGSQQPFDTKLLAFLPSQEEAWALDRRVEWARQGSP